MVFRWITWSRAKVNNGFFKDPDTFPFDENVSFRSYGFSDGSVFIGGVKGLAADVDSFISNHPDFNMTVKTESEIIGLLDSWYSDYQIIDGKPSLFEIDAEEIIDNRVIEDTV